MNACNVQGDVFVYDSFMEWLEGGFTSGGRAQIDERAGLNLRLLQLLQWSTMSPLGIACIDGLLDRAKMTFVVQGLGGNSSGWAMLCYAYCILMYG